MEQKSNIDTSLETSSLIWNLPITFNIDDRRPITFKCPTVKDLFEDKDLKKFIGFVSLTPKKVKESTTLKLPFKYESQGDLIKGLITFTEYGIILAKYFIKYIPDSEYTNREIIVGGEKIISTEFDYIAKAMLVSMNQMPYEEIEIKKEAKKEEINPIIKDIMEKQKEAEDKLKKIKAKKDKSSGLKIEEILLAITYEFRLAPDYLLSLNYYGLIWYFGYVGKVDAHKLNQQILSSGMSKQKSYNYWLNK
jgi:hypothetical protein